MYRSLGQPEEALAAARKVAEADPERRAGRSSTSPSWRSRRATSTRPPRPSRACETRLETPDDEVAALHGRIKVELAREQPERALELAREASAIDSLGRTAGVLAHLELELGAEGTPEEAVARGATTVFMQAQELPPSRVEVEALLDATLADLRGSLLGEDRRVEAQAGG